MTNAHEMFDSRMFDKIDAWMFDHGGYGSDDDLRAAKLRLEDEVKFLNRVMDIPGNPFSYVECRVWVHVFVNVVLHYIVIDGER